ncbi:UNVERIFIED_CONTAM: hypothetical protein FKN15_022844 [Acipenser sinensis]
MGPCIFAKSSRISDLNSQISGIEELLDEFRKQLQQDQQENRGDGMGPVDVCLDSFNAIEDYIIRAKDSIDSGATFLTAPGRIYSWRDCLHVCCSDPHCTVAVVELERERSEDSLNCFLFNCTYKNRNVCKFSLHQGYSSYSLLSFNNTLYPGDNGADSDLTSKHAGSRKGPHENNLVYDATIQEGSYHFQLTVTDTGGQKSSDNVTVTVLPSERKVPVCTGLCSRYQFMCDDGCCVDITFACDGRKQCLDGSDEAFCQSIEGSRKSVTHSSDVSQMKTMSLTDGGEYRTTAEEPRKTTMEKLQPSLHTYNREETNPPLTQGKTTQNNIHVTEDCLAPPAAGLCKGIFPRWFFEASTGTCKHFLYGGCKGNGNNFLQETHCINACMKKQDKESTQNTIDLSSSINSEPAGAPQEEDSVDKGESVDTLLKADQAGDGHPVPESGAVLPLALGLAITALLLLMVACRLRLVRQKLKKARPITSEESDYLINGMYL